MIAQRHQVRPVTTILSATLLALGLAGPSLSQPLKGGVKEKSIQRTQPSLTRESDRFVDPFDTSGGGNGPGSGAASSGTVSPKPAHKAPETTDTFSVTPEPFKMDKEDEKPAQTPHKANPSPAPDQFKSDTFHGDPDKTPQMELQWEAWHKNLAANIYRTFQIWTRTQIKNKSPLVCKVSYVVTHNGMIEDLKITQPSSDPAFNALVEKLIKSMEKRSELRFPQNSQRKSVNKSATFTLNEVKNGGFNYQKGDKEVIGR